MTVRVLPERTAVCARRRLHELVALLAFLASVSPADAQSIVSPQGPELQSGARIRVKPTDEWPSVPVGKRRVGTLRALTRDSLTVAWTDGGTVTMPLAYVARLEASQGREHFVGRGVLVGVAAGAAVGAIVGTASYDNSACGESGCFLDFGRGFNTAVGAAIGGGVGLVVGGTIGSIGRREVWRRVRLDALTSRVSVIPLPAARGVAVRWAIGR